MSWSMNDWCLEMAASYSFFWASSLCLLSFTNCFDFSDAVLCCCSKPVLLWEGCLECPQIIYLSKCMYYILNIKSILMSIKLSLGIKIFILSDLSTAQDLLSVSNSNFSVITSSESSATDLVSNSLRLGRLDLVCPAYQKYLQIYIKGDSKISSFLKT